MTRELHTINIHGFVRAGDWLIRLVDAGVDRAIVHDGGRATIHLQGNLALFPVPGAGASRNAAGRVILEFEAEGDVEAHGETGFSGEDIEAICAYLGG